MDKILRGPSALFLILKDYSVSKAFKCKQRPKSHKLRYRIVDCFVYKHWDKSFALKRLGLLQLCKFKAALHQPAKKDYFVYLIYQTWKEREGKRKLVHNMYWDIEKDGWFIDRLCKDILKFIKMFKKTRTEYSLPEDLQVKTFLFVFKKTVNEIFVEGSIKLRFFSYCESYANCSV